MVSILPYTKMDGIRTVTDSEMKALFVRTVKEDLSDIVFYEGTIKTPEEFLAMSKTPGTLFHLLKGGSATVGYMWLNRFENRTARLHFCMFREYWSGAVFLGRYVLNALLCMKTKDGEHLFDLLTGFIPTWNKRAIDFVLACGGETHGAIPNSIYNDKTGKSESAVFLYCRRKEDD